MLAIKIGLVFFSILIGMWYVERGGNFVTGFIGSLILSPILMGILILFTTDAPKKDNKR